MPKAHATRNTLNLSLMMTLPRLDIDDDDAGVETLVYTREAWDEVHERARRIARINAKWHPVATTHIGHNVIDDETEDGITDEETMVDVEVTEERLSVHGVERPSRSSVWRRPIKVLRAQVPAGWFIVTAAVLSVDAAVVVGTLLSQNGILPW